MLFYLWLSRESFEAITKFHDFYESIDELLMFTLGMLGLVPSYGVIIEGKLPHYSWSEL